jgi:hypothetical protein
MFCQKCGKENRDGATFCNACGASLVSIPVQSTNESKPQNDLVVPKIMTKENLQAEPISEPGSSPIIPSKKDGIKFWAAVIIGIVVVVIVGAAVLAATTGNAPKYQAGDVISDNTTDPMGTLILGYNRTSDRYVERIILQKSDGSWGYLVSQFNTHESSATRAGFEANYTVLASHISDPTSITTIDENNPPPDVMILKISGYYSQTATPTPTVTSTITSTVIGSQDPIVGVWRYSSSTGSDDRYRFNGDGTYVESFYIPDTGTTTVDSGTWFLTGTNTYKVTDGATGESATFRVDTYQGGIYSEDYPNLIYTPYQGDVAAVSTLSGAEGSPASSGGSQTTQLSGTGDDVQSFTTTGDGMRIFSMSYDGEDYFSVWLEDAYGNRLDLLVSNIGSYSGKTLETLGPGTYYLDVKASGPWTVTITSV